MKKPPKRNAAKKKASGLSLKIEKPVARKRRQIARALIRRKKAAE
ncbi:MAG TPA: hypothetical protein VG889_22590 [Rhizomicrobium sp.]|nr:hypothetical protein [Rhizomicrobium sp.]